MASLVVMAPGGVAPEGLVGAVVAATVGAAGVETIGAAAVSVVVGAGIGDVAVGVTVMTAELVSLGLRALKYSSSTICSLVESCSR
jgi:hypothetical protein